MGGNQTIVGVKVEVGGSNVLVGKGGSGRRKGAHAPVANAENNIATRTVFMCLVYYEIAGQDDIVL